jgi:hypothetical protein
MTGSDGHAGQASPPSLIAWRPTTPLDQLQAEAATVGQDLGAVVLGTLHWERSRLVAGLTALARMLDELYTESPRLNFRKEQYPPGTYRSPEGPPDLDQITVLHPISGKHPPNHLRLLPEDWRTSREWPHKLVTLASPPPFVSNGYGIRFKTQGWLFIGVGETLAAQWWQELRHHPDAPERFTNPVSAAEDQYRHL